MNNKPTTSSTPATSIFFQGPREEQDRALAKLRNKVFLSKAKEVTLYGTTMTAAGAFAGMCLLGPHGVFMSAVLGAGLGIGSALAVNRRIQKEENDDILRPAVYRTKFAAENMVGEHISLKTAEQLHELVKNKSNPKP